MSKRNKPSAAAPRISKAAKIDYATYLGVILAFAVVTLLSSQGMLSRSFQGQLVPICCYICLLYTSDAADEL